MNCALQLALHYIESVIWQWAEWYDTTHTVTVPACTKNFLCTCERRSCPGRTIAISTYARKVLNA